MTKLRVLILTQWFEPEPTIKGLVFARELVKQGYEVEVVTGFPNYPGGTVYPGYEISWLARERIDGVDVTRVALYPSHDTSALRRMASYGSFAAAALLYCLFGARRPDVVYVYQLPTKGVVAAILRFVRGCPFVYDVEDIWPDTLRASGVVGNSLVVAAAGGIARWAYRQADALVVISDGFRDLLIDRGVDPGRIEMVPNWCDEASLRATGDGASVAFPADDRFRVLFAGNMGPAQALDRVLDAAELLLVRDPRIVLIFLGSGLDAHRLKAAAATRRLTNVLFLPRVPVAQVGDYLRRADALLVHLKADPLFAITIPSKTQAYMAIGKPILMAAAGNAADVVRAAQCGIAATPEDPPSIAEAAMRLAALTPAELAAMGRRGRAYYDERLALTVGAGRIGALLARVATARSASVPTGP